MFNKVNTAQLIAVEITRTMPLTSQCKVRYRQVELACALYNREYAEAYSCAKGNGEMPFADKVPAVLVSFGGHVLSFSVGNLTTSASYCVLSSSSKLSPILSPAASA